MADIGNNNSQGLATTQKDGAATPVTSTPTSTRISEVACWDKATNPWFGVANFVPLPDEAYQQGYDRFPFTSLPVEVIYYLAKLLPKETAVALALTSWALYSILGPRFLGNLSDEENWRLLLLLERDTDLLVACQLCKKLHGPSAPLAAVPNSTSFFASNDCPKLAPLTCLRKQWIVVPEGATFAFCRLVAKRYIRHQPYGDLLTMAARTKIYTLPDFKLFGTTIYRVMDGQLFVRQETIIAPFRLEGEFTGRSAYLVHAVTAGYHAPAICPHQFWVQLGLMLSDDRTTKSYIRSHAAFEKDDRYAAAHKPVDPGSGTSEGSSYSGSDHEDHPHRRECYDATPVPRTFLTQAPGPNLKCALLHLQPCLSNDCPEDASEYHINIVRSCRICMTDWCVSAQDVEGIGRVMGLTTWKNLGGVYEGQWAAWNSHMERWADSDTDGTQSAATNAPSEARRPEATVYAAFENVSGSGTTIGTPLLRTKFYTPSIGRRILARFTEEPNVDDYHWDWYIPSWSYH